MAITTRRQLLSAFGAAAAWPLAVRAQNSAKPVIGFLHPGSPDYYPSALAAFHAGLAELGFAEGQNVAVAYRWAEGHQERLPAMAAELVRLPVAVIAATGGGSSAYAAKAATTGIPVVFNSAGDPVKDGLVAALNQPGANLTGVGRLGIELMPKRLELLHEATAMTSRVAYLLDTDSAVAASPLPEEAAHRLGLDLQIVRTKAGQDLKQVFEKLNHGDVKGLVIGNSSFFNARSRQLGELCLQSRLPAVFSLREFATAGGLMSYGPSLEDAYRIVGQYTGRILKGESPATLPVQLQTKVELVINLQTAHLLDLAVPLPLLGRADEVIE